MRLGKSALVYFVSQVGLSISGFIATFAIARLLGAEILGVYSVTVALLFWLNVPTTAISSTVTKRISEGTSQGSFLTIGFLTNGALAIVISLGIVAFGEYIDRYVGAPVSTILMVIVLGNISLYTVTGMLDGQKMVAIRGILQALERVLRTGLQVALIFLGWELSGLLFGHAVSLMVASLVGVLLFEVRPSIPTRQQIRRFFKYAQYSWLGTIKTRAFAWMDTIVLAFFVSSTLIGIYEVAWRLASIFALISLSVQQTLFPTLSELSADGETDRIHHLLNEGLLFTGIFCIPGIVGATILGDRVLRIYRPEFAQGAQILVILVVARMISAFGSQFLSAVNAVDRPDLAFRINAAFVISNVGLNIVLITEYGWYGAAGATAISALVTLAYGYYILYRLIGRPNVPTREISYQILSAGLMGAVLVPVVENIPQNHYLTISAVGLGVFVYLLILLIVSERVRQKARSVFLNSIDN